MSSVTERIVPFGGIYELGTSNRGTTEAEETGSPDAMGEIMKREEIGEWKGRA